MSTQLAAMRAYVGARPTVPPPAAPRPTATAAVGNVVVFGSGKGGAGTSVVAALVALAAAGAGRRVLLVDADEHVGPLGHLLGVRPKHALSALRAGLEPGALLVPVSETLTLLPGGPAADDQPLAPAERRALFRRVSALYADYELVVIDGGSQLDLVCACCEGAATAAGTTGGGEARLVAVTGVDPISLAATYALVKAAAARSGVSAAEVLVNRADGDAAAQAFAYADDASRQFLGRTLHYAGSLPDDGSLDLALRAGMTLLDAAAGSPAAVAAQELATRLLRPPGGGAARPRAGTIPAASPRVLR